MNSMNDERFFDLAMKVIARHASDAERTELNAALTRQPELKAEYERLQAEVLIAKETLSLVNATEATAGELPAYARGRLQAKVRQTLGRSPAAAESQSEREQGMMWKWRWVLGLATATAVVVLLVVPALRTPSEAVIQVAMLDTTGVTRGADTNEAALLHQSWEKTSVDSLTSDEMLREWEVNWPAARHQPVVKVVYDRAAGEVRVTGRWQAKEFSKIFPVDGSLAETLKQAKAYIAEQTGR